MSTRSSSTPAAPRRASTAPKETFTASEETLTGLEVPSKLNSAQFLQLENSLDEKIQIWMKEDEAYYRDTGTQIIEQTKLYRLAARAPKGGHLHIHFNSCLGPDFLLDIAKQKEVNQWMYISFPRLEGPLTKADLSLVKHVKFHFMASVNNERSHVSTGSVFGQDYRKLTDKKRTAIELKWLKEEENDITDNEKLIMQTNTLIQEGKLKGETKELKWLQKRKERLIGVRKNLAKQKETPFEKKINLDERMLFKEFIAEFDAKGWGEDAMTWLQGKLVFSANEVKYRAGTDETCKKQWDKFDVRTQMMTGLFTNEHAYRKYTYELLKSLQKENIQYAEIRPNFMQKNQVYSKEDPKKLIDNFGIMDIIIEVYKKYQKDREQMGQPRFGGLKVIYCTPRVFKKDQIEGSLNECLSMKMNPKYRDFIAGFDIIGPENAPNPLSFFKEELRDFQRLCTENNVSCPFLFHAGESHNDPDGNLDVALDLGAKRIAHGYAIPENDAVRHRCEKRGEAKNLCIECCPISNEILGLHPKAKGAVVHKLMRHGIPCALASDNPTLFSSTLSHDFYQFMIGKEGKGDKEEDFHLRDWRRLMECSLKHAVWNCDEERNKVVGIWADRYQKFVKDALKDDFFDTDKPAGHDVSRGTKSGDLADQGAPPARPTGTTAQSQVHNKNRAAVGPAPDASTDPGKAASSQQVTRKPPAASPKKKLAHGRANSNDHTTSSTAAAATTSGPMQKQVNGGVPTPEPGTGGTPARNNVNNSTSTTAHRDKTGPLGTLTSKQTSQGATGTQARGQGSGSTRANMPTSVPLTATRR